MNENDEKIMRITPNKRYENTPCSIVAVGSAHDALYRSLFDENICPSGLKENGYLSLEDMNRFVRDCLKVDKKVYFKRGTRPSLGEFLTSSKPGHYIVCVRGHYVYAISHTHGMCIYVSFFDNEDDEVVCAWTLGI